MGGRSACDVAIRQTSDTINHGLPSPPPSKSRRILAVQSHHWVDFSPRQTERDGACTLTQFSLWLTLAGLEVNKIKTITKKQDSSEQTHVFTRQQEKGAWFLPSFVSIH